MTQLILQVGELFCIHLGEVYAPPLFLYFLCLMRMLGKHVAMPVQPCLIEHVALGCSKSTSVHGFKY